MGTIRRIRDKQFISKITNATRQYFVGDLSRPQKEEFFKDERLEIGISIYPQFKCEDAHRHTVTTEYQYVISGWTQYMDIETGEVFDFKAGDFYLISPNTKYIQKVKAGTKIIFIKAPSKNDKEKVEISKKVEEWAKTPMKTIRTDYYHDNDAPPANAIKPAAAIAVVNDKNQLLLLKRKDSKMWTIPGGTMEFGEGLCECAIREVQEESGLKVEIKDIIGIYADPQVRVLYSDGEVRQEFTVVYFAEVSEGEIILDEESSQFKWVDLNELLDLPLAGSQRRRLEEVIRYIRTGEKKLI